MTMALISEESSIPNQLVGCIVYTVYCKDIVLDRYILLYSLSYFNIMTFFMYVKGKIMIRSSIVS